MQLNHELAQAILESHPQQGARVLERLAPKTSSLILAALSPEQAWGVLRFMVPSSSAQVFAALPDEQARALLRVAPSQYAAGLCRRAPKERAAALIAGLPGDRRRRIEALLQQREGTAGGLADPDVLALPEALTAGEARSTFKEELIRATHDLPVVSPNDQLIGMVALHELVVAGRGQTMVSIMRVEFPSIPVRSSHRAVLEHPGWQVHASLPVVDGAGAFVGMLRYESLRGLEQAMSATASSGQVSTARALGDVFGVGVGGMLEAILGASSGDSNVR